MYTILVYDMNEKRVGRALKICRRYLNWVQNSVFEGEITSAKLEKLKMEMRKLMNDKEDSVIIYTMRTDRYTDRQIMGIEKGGEKTII